MITFSIEIIETTVVVVIMIVLRLLSRSAVSRALKKFNFSYQIRKLILKLINVLVVMLGLLAIIAIWGIKQKDLFIFLSSLLTVLGIAFFAQWSLLSNITSGLILFFNHPVKLGDTIEGQVKDIGYYFVHLETLEGERLTIPNSALIQKMVSIKHISEQ
jgi:small-conductance mechanosensitive channel